MRVHNQHKHSHPSLKPLAHLFDQINKKQDILAYKCTPHIHGGARYDKLKTDYL